jgi:hypothetical protein
MAVRSFPSVIGALALNACCAGVGAAPNPTPQATTPPPPPVTTAPPPVGTLPYTIAPGVPTWSTSYAVGHLADGNPSTAWYTPASHPLPVVLTLALASPAQLVGLDFDTHLGSYATSAARDVEVEVFGRDGQLATQTRGALAQEATTSMALPMPVEAASVRITLRSNHGGSYTGLAGLDLRSTPGTGLPPLPSVDRGLPYTVAGLPQWNDTYAVGMMSDGNPSTQWFTPMSPTFPQTGVLQLASPSTVAGVLFDTHLGSYGTSAARDVTVELVSMAGQVLASQNVSLPPDATTTVPFPPGVVAAQVRVTLRSNHGGPYLGIAELYVLGAPAAP